MTLAPGGRGDDDQGVTDLPSAIVDTHVSTVVFVGDRAFKRKRPVRTGFLDFTTVEARAEACRREVELNRRLAPDVYEGVGQLVLDDRVLEHVVVMRRLPEELRLASLLDDASVDRHLRQLAHVIATFHDSADRGPHIDEAADRDAMAGLWAEGIEQLGDVGRGVIDEEDIELSGRLSQEYLAGRRPLFDQRIADRRACDGHGDLQAEDIFCLPDGPRVLDCLEFDDRLRFGDVLLDVAFLTMDLERLGRPDLADLFLDRYRELSGDSWPASLAHHYVAYRAHVRAKVACIRRHQGDPSALGRARILHELALEHLHAGRVHLVLVGGSPGTGKSALSEALAARIDAVVLSSDRVRDELHPRVDGGERDGLHTGRYAPERVQEVYDELLRRAALLLEHGERVVIDASWLDPVRRAEAAAVAARTASRLGELRCTCAPDLAAARIRERTRVGGDPSEATPGVARELAAAAPPWSEAIEVDTSLPVEDVANVAEVLVGRD